ncbi:hypothetical protein PMAYCL1PPCAC_32418, partial [Pristionchus mayeri]
RKGNWNQYTYKCNHEWNKGVYLTLEYINGQETVPFTSMTTSMDPKEAYNKERSLRRVTFLSVAVSTACVIMAIVVVPMCFHYSTMVHTNIQAEVDFCIERSSGIWRKFESLEYASGRARRNTFEDHQKMHLNVIERHIRRMAAMQRALALGAGAYDAAGAGAPPPEIVASGYSSPGAAAAAGGGGSCCSCGM